MNLATNPFTANRYAFGAGNPTNNIENDGHDPYGCSPTSDTCVQENNKRARIEAGMSPEPTGRTYPARATVTGPPAGSGGGCSPAERYMRRGCNGGPASIFDQPPRYTPSSTPPPAQVDWSDTIKFTALYFSAIFLGPEDLAIAGIVRGIALAARAAKGERAVQKALETAGDGAHGPDLTGVSDKQFGRKWGRHAQDYGLNPGDTAARKWFEDRIYEVRASHDDVRRGSWNPQGGGGDDYWFYRKDNDLLITKGDGTFVTMFPLGRDGNSWFNGATRTP